MPRADELASIRAVAAPPYQEGNTVHRVVDVPGRRTGAPQPFPVSVTQHGGRHYVCAATRRRDWVQNLLAADSCRVERDGVDGADTVRSPVLVTGTEAATVLACYLPQAGYTDPVLPFAADAPVAEIVRHTGAVAVFRLDVAER